MTAKIRSFFHAQKKFIGASTDFLGKRQSDILIAAGIIMVSYASSMVLGLVRQRLLGSLFFECCKAELDVYKAAFRFPDMLFQVLIIGTFSSAFIPVFSDQLQISKERAYRLAHTMLVALTIALAVGSGLVLMFDRQAASLLTGNFTSDQIDLMVKIMPYMLITQFLFLASQWLSSILQSNQRFLAPALSPIAYNFGIILGIVALSPHYGIYGPVWGGIIGALFHFLIQLPGSKAIPIRDIHIDFKDPLLRRIFKLSLPRMIALGITELELSITVNLATSLAASSLFLYDLASQLRLVPVQVVGVAIGQAALPTLSSLSNHNKQRFQSTLQDTLHQIIYLILPITMVILILRIPIVRLAFGSSAFPWPATTQTAWTLAMFSIAIPAYAILQLLIRAFYAAKDTTTPLLINILGFAIFGIFGYLFTFQVHQEIGFNAFGSDIVLLKPGDIRNIALAVSLSSILKLLFGLYLLDRQVKYVTPSWMKEIGKLLLATAVMGIAMWQFFRLLDDDVIFNTTRVIPLLAFTITVTCLALTAYLVSCHMLHSRSQQLLFRLVVKFPGFKQVLQRTQAWMEPLSGTPQP